MKTDKEYIVNVIYTFHTKEQEFADVWINNEDLLNKENFLKKIIVGVLEEDEFLQLIKISTCIGGVEDEMDIEGWYMKSNGKFWIQSGDFSTLYPYFINKVNSINKDVAKFSIMSLNQLEELLVEAKNERTDKIDEYLSSQLSYYTKEGPFILKCECGNTHTYTEKYNLYRVVKNGGLCGNCRKTQSVRRIEVRERIRQSKLGVPLSDTHRKNTSLGLKGRNLTEEHKKNVSNGMKNYWKRKKELENEN